jgi:hypothetical protein
MRWYRKDSEPGIFVGYCTVQVYGANEYNDLYSGVILFRKLGRHDNNGVVLT